MPEFIRKQYHNRNNNRADIRVYKFSERNGNWSIIVSDDEFLAKEMYIKDYNLHDNAFLNKEVNTEVLPYSYKIKSPFYKEEVSIGAIIKHVENYLPKCLADRESYECE